MLLSDSWKSSMLRIVSGVVGLALWELAGRQLGLIAIPPVTSVVRAWTVLALDGSLVDGLIISTKSWSAGFVLAVVVGVPLGLVMGALDEVDHLLAPYVNALLALPSVAYIPVVMLWLGFGFAARAVIVFEFAVLVIVLNARAGVRSVDGEIVEMARSFDLPARSIFARVMLPAALPEVFAGVRLGLGRSIKGIVVAEVLMTLVGLGGMVSYYGGAFRIDFLLAIVLTIVVASLVLTGLLQLLDARLNEWKLARG